jgi:hypothetical protein
MSNSIVPLQLLTTQDPITRINNVRPYTILKGPSYVGYNIVQPSGSSNTTSNSFNLNPNNRRTVMDRKIYLNASGTIRFTGTGSTGGLLQPHYDAMRASPLTKCIQQMSLQVGNNTVTTNLNEYYNIYERFNSSHDFQNRELSISPSMPDNYVDYSASVLADNSELNDYRFNSTQCPRGFVGPSVLGGGLDYTVSNSWYSVTQNNLNGLTAGATADVKFNITEPLYLSPMLYESTNHSGFIGIDTLTLNIQLNNLQMMWSHSLNSPSNILTTNGSNTAFSISNFNIQCLTRQLNPDIVQPIPDFIPYPYNKFSSYPSQQFTLNQFGSTGTSMNITLGNQNLTSIPTRAYVYVQNTQGTRNLSSTDTFAVLDQVTVTWNSVPLFGANCTQQDLYNISVKNGCNMSWEQWSLKVGSIFAFDFGVDVGLNPNQCAGLLQKNTINVNVVCHNQSVNAQTLQLYLLIVEEGTLSIINGQTVIQVGVLNEQDALNAEANRNEIPYHNERNIYGGKRHGGDFFGDLWTGFKKPFEFIYDNKDKIIDTAKTVAPLLGLGEVNDAFVNDAIEGGRRHRKRSHKGGYIGGKRSKRSKKSKRSHKGGKHRKLSKKHLK